MEDTRWEAKMTPHSSTEEDNGDKIEGGDEHEHDTSNEDVIDEEDGCDLVEELTPLVVGGNTKCTRQPPRCGAHLAR
ncbi:hypothetical protein J1N35_004811 [Gossypium stocksii]|uniref:Uncharacterized protein n=1 Tax=Gossypium stocksii TaxID=47602 RepID=A0A9D3WCX8_9ROSI|nr:hypothetical protein J1N35_004811 [Gossypium stocksii]